MTLTRRDLIAATAGVLTAGAPLAGTFAQSPTHVQLGDVSRTAASWILEIARVAGFYDREKLAVDTTYLGNNPAVAQQVVGSSFDLGITTVETAIRAIESGAPIMMIGSGMMKFPYSFMAAPSITTPADIKGKKIILDLPKGFLSFKWGQWARSNNIAPSDVEIVYDGSSTNRFAALIAGAVSVAPMTQPLDFIALDKGYKKMIDMGVYASDFGFTGLIARTAWLNENAATARAFLRAASSACDYFYDPKNRAASITALVGLSKVDPAIGGKVYDYYTTRLHPYAKKMDLPDAYVKGVAEYLEQSGALSSVGPTSKYVDHRFIV